MRIRGGDDRRRRTSETGERKWGVVEAWVQVEKLRLQQGEDRLNPTEVGNAQVEECTVLAK